MRQFVVIGLGRFGITVAKILAKKGFQVIAIDSDEERVRDASEFATIAVQLDATDSASLQKIGLKDVDAAIIAVGENISASILITMICKDAGIPTVISKATNPLQGKILAKIGADKVVFPERDMGEKLAESLASPGIFDYISVSKDHSIMEISAPSVFIGKTLGDVNLRAKYGVTVIAIKHKVPGIDEQGESTFSQEIIIAPTSKDTISKGDTLVVLGKIKDLERLKGLI
ncbi:TrkA family potassium uptake protein [candidate division WOR-3 bacterium]|nr:TrkA family potassium uptake protein [candidate division WOR-3 bacterium]